ncbi:MAG: hypothetical protein ACKV2Q_12745 [Planctomycetaceae bacterium]
MTLLLCPECCQWREPIEGRCPVCVGTLDLAIPDLSLAALADEIGDLRGTLGEAELSQSHLPNSGGLWATSNGLLFVPHESRVIVFADAPDAASVARQRSLSQLVSQFWSRLMGRAPAARFACEQRTTELIGRDRLALAELLLSDPGVLFWSRGTIATWRRQRGRWEFIRPNTSAWPERIAMADRDGDRALQTWLETTLCPLPVTVR